MSRHVRLSSSLLALVVTASLVVSTSCGRKPPSAQPPTPTASPTVTTPQPTLSPTPTPAPTTQPPTSRPPTQSRPPTTTRTTTTRPPAVPISLRGKDIEVIPTSRRVVALTFDAGANGDGLASILTTLEREDVRATFFIKGGFAASYPASIAAIVAAGHRLGNHTATHPHLPALGTDAAVVNEIRQAETQIKTAGGTDPRPLFRFPYGDRTSHTIAVVNDAGYVAVRWTVDTLGWKGTSGGVSAQIVVDRVVSAARPGEIVLMHVGSNPDDHTTLDAQALPTVIARLRGLGYEFVTLDALLG